MLPLFTHCCFSLYSAHIKSKDENRHRTLGCKSLLYCICNHRVTKVKNMFNKRHVDEDASHCVYAPQYYKHRTVQMLKNKNIRAYQLHHRLVVCFFVYF